jgi:hypothetical protein
VGVSAIIVELIFLCSPRIMDLVIMYNNNSNLILIQFLIYVRYADNNYELQSGVQMNAIYQMVKRLGLWK